MSTVKIKSHYNEAWQEVETKEPTKKCDYFISNYGRIKSVNKTSGDENLLKGSTVRGFNMLNIRLQDNSSLGTYVHKFVAESFIKKKKEEQDFVVHKDGDKKNNFWKNLKWVTREELTAIQVEKGLYSPKNRKRASHVKMTESKVRLLKKRIKAGKTKKKILAKQFEISTMQLNRIERGENWGHVE